MKKILWLLMIIIILTLAGCNNTQKLIKQDGLSLENKNDISIQSPIVFSKNSVAFGDSKTLYVNIEMTSGQYVFDELPGALQGNNWSGQYQIRIYTDEDNYKNPIYLAPIFIDDQTMNFKSEFSLVFDDYNNDNNPDFTLGQYVSSNGYEYALFTINQTGEVEKLDTDGLMFISEHDYSVKLEKLSLTSFKKSSYDNSVGKTVERVYQWTDDKFIPEDNTEKAANNNVIWQADLNHDGIEDQIIVEILNDANIGEGVTISVYKNNTDLLIYSEQASLSHAGWNGFYLYNDTNGAYLLNWQPTMYQGYGTYKYEIFSFDKQGFKIVLDSGLFEFNSVDLRCQYTRLEEFVQYIQKVNSYLLQSHLIADTDGGELLYGTPDSGTVNPYVPKWLFDIF